ncbi:MAG TPA: microviridin/marinostatin family tricyclic proteinase inhibitor [Nostocaceae cyanobacterium]|nr:microviridin/marinostatin family tricyclic proteinase inhibitor [Nostocaceae cyanobacterium]
MSNIKVENLDSQALPFFARFLENQNEQDVSAEEMENVTGGARPITTQKFPNDNADTATTKAPFDQETFVTLKYPSDNEDSGTVVIEL